jgi:hypothetical protein
LEYLFEEVLGGGGVVAVEVEGGGAEGEAIAAQHDGLALAFELGKRLHELGTILV